ncbi:MAG TPA: D-aminoacyl-tRNA deacylase [Melioribacteraceae bacterium]|nr:D-aminoacyl-tRNA deacylase [Melioribacteraceae bacterium]
MRALIQRVSEAAVFVDELNYKAEINKGMVILLGVKNEDKIADVSFVADKCLNLRIFEDENNKMNLSVKEINGELLIVSQFTLYGETKKGNRPNFTEAATAEIAESFYNLFIERIKNNYPKEKIKTGIFGAMMKVKILNDGPVTVLVESK